MALEKVFNIAAAFKFEVGEGLANISKLESGFNKLSNTMENLNTQAKVLFSAHTLSLTGGAAGIVGTMQKMVSSSESYYQFQRKISTIIVANTKGQADFNLAMRQSGQIIREIANDAQKFALPIDSYKQVFSDLAGPMAAKGVAGNNFENTRGLARSFMMMSRVFPVSEIELQNVLAGAVTNQNPLFRLLKADTEAFKNMTPGRWRGMKFGAKVQKLQEGFDQYSMRNPEIMNSYVRSFTGQLVILSNYFKSITSVMKSLGDVLRSVLVPILTKVNDWIKGKLKDTLDQIAKALQPLTQDLSRLYVEFDKLRRLGGTFSTSKMAAGLTFFIVEFKKFIPFILKMATAMGLITGRGALAAGGGFLALLKWMTKTNSLATALGASIAFVAKGMATYLSFLVPITALLRVIDSAKAQAKIEDMKKYTSELPIVTDKAIEVARALAAIQFPLSHLINVLGEKISFLFQRTWWVEQIYNTLKRFDIEKLARNFSSGLLYLYTALESFFKTIAQQAWKIFTNPMKLLSPSVTDSVDSFMKGYFKNLDKALGPRLDKMDKHFDKYLKDAEKQPVPVYQNFGKIEIRNQFRENVEPDRIAVAVKEAFLKSEQARIDTDRRLQTFVPATGYGGN